MNQANSRPSWLVVPVSLVVTLTLWAATVGWISRPPATGGIDVVAGSGTFRDRCGACHIVEKGISTHHGPNLYDIGKVAATRKPPLSAAEYILESLLDPDAFVAPTNHRGMPKNLATKLSPEEIRNVVGYLAGRGAAPDYQQIRELNIPDLRPTGTTRVIRRDQMELADHLLSGRATCLECHSRYRNAEYLVFAPGLFSVGLSDPALVRESIVDPSKQIAPMHQSVNVVLADGREISGKLISRTDDQLLLLSRNARNEWVPMQIPLASVEQEDGQPLVEPSPLSPMPTGFEQLLSKEELDAIVTMIEQLN
jgi:mono/diheme cytochrome c family protein